MTARIDSINVSVEESMEDWHYFLGGEEFGGPDNTKKMEEQWESGVRGYYSLIVTVNVVTNSNRIVPVRGALSAIDLLRDTEEHRRDSSEYLEEEARNIYLHELRPELIKDFRVPAKEVDRAYKEFDWSGVWS